MQLAWQFLDPADPAHQQALASLYQPAPQEDDKAAAQASLLGLLNGAGACGLLGLYHNQALFFVLGRQSGPVCDIIELATRAEFRRRGIALAGITRFCQMMASQQPEAEIFLEVAADNLAARNLYQKAGFAEQARRPDYYRRGNGRVDAHLLSWRAGAGPAHIESLAKGC